MKIVHKNKIRHTRKPKRGYELFVRCCKAEVSMQTKSVSCPCRASAGGVTAVATLTKEQVEDARNTEKGETTVQVRCHFRSSTGVSGVSDASFAWVCEDNLTISGDFVLGAFLV